MLLDKSGKLVKSLDFRGTKIEYLDRLTAKELFLIMTAAQQSVNLKESFKAKDLAPKNWKGTIYEPIANACKDDKNYADRLFGVIIKQALIMTPLLFRQASSDNEFEATTYIRESLEY
ncbi:MAG: hypothetical protein FWH03_00345 [Firmicutes bacterium]|nr:hypothetical protein [Bacillota bacterium]